MWALLHKNYAFKFSFLKKGGLGEVENARLSNEVTDIDGGMGHNIENGGF